MSKPIQSSHRLETHSRMAKPAAQPVSTEQVHRYFAPYQRVSPPWDFYEILKTLLVALFILPLRVLYLLLASTVLVIIASIAMIGVKSSHTAQMSSVEEGKPPASFDEDSLFQPPPKWRKILISMLFPLCRSILFFSFGVYYVSMDNKQFSHKPPQPANSAQPAKAYVIVANHLGYIDILVLLSMFRGSFVAKGELENAFVVGRLARALQCMFVRKGQSLTSQLINRVRSTYQCHEERETCPSCPACMSKLVIFPEGTTSNGTAMVPFRTGIFNAGLPVKPVCIQFPYQHFNLSWETIRFREHLFRTMTQVRNCVHCIELPVYEPSEEEKLDARLYALNVQQEMATALQVPIQPLNRRHKFLYHSFLLGREPDAAEVLRKAQQISNEDEQILFVKERMGEEIV